MFYCELENVKMAKLNAKWTGIILIDNDFLVVSFRKNPLPPVAWLLVWVHARWRIPAPASELFGLFVAGWASSLPSLRQNHFFPCANSHTLPTLTGSVSLVPQAVLSSLPTFWEATDHVMVIAHIAIAQSDKQISQTNMSLRWSCSRIFSASSQMNIQRKTIILWGRQPALHFPQQRNTFCVTVYSKGPIIHLFCQAPLVHTDFHNLKF